MAVAFWSHGLACGWSTVLLHLAVSRLARGAREEVRLLIKHSRIHSDGLCYMFFMINRGAQIGQWAVIWFLFSISWGNSCLCRLVGDKIIRDRKSQIWERKCRIGRRMLREGIGYHTYLVIPERPTGQISINIHWTFPHGASAHAMHLYDSQVYSLSHAAHVLLTLLLYLYRQTCPLNWQRLEYHLVK